MSRSNLNILNYERQDVDNRNNPIIPPAPPSPPSDNVFFDFDIEIIGDQAYTDILNGDNDILSVVFDQPEENIVYSWRFSSPSLTVNKSVNIISSVEIDFKGLDLGNITEETYTNPTIPLTLSLILPTTFIPGQELSLDVQGEDQLTNINYTWLTYTDPNYPEIYDFSLGSFSFDLEVIGDQVYTDILNGDDDLISFSIGIDLQAISEFKWKFSSPNFSMNKTNIRSI